jgi:hypothetical protein
MKTTKPINTAKFKVTKRVDDGFLPDVEDFGDIAHRRRIGLVKAEEIAKDDVTDLYITVSYSDDKRLALFLKDVAKDDAIDCDLARV